MSDHLEKLQTEAQRIVESTMDTLPEPVRRHAQALPVSYDARPQQGLIDEGYDSDLLGLFVGAPLAEPDECPLPPQIILFIETIWDFAEADADIFREEVRTTYLHELGHYLGLDEIDLENRGLD